VGSWQPIETLETEDGTAVLLWFRPDQQRPVFKDGGVIEGTWFSAGAGYEEGWETGLGPIGEPAYWMPLPDAPEPP
jgi:hypothetical protein